MKFSIWTIEGRLQRFKKKVTPERLEKLKKKRLGQLKRLIIKYKKVFPQQVQRWESKLKNG